MAINQRLINRVKADLQTLVEDAQTLPLDQRVDFGFHLRQIKDFVEKAEKPFAEEIKIYGNTHSLSVVNGIIYDGHIMRVDKQILDTERVKSFLGVRLSQYQVERSEIHLKYKPKFA